MRRSICFLLALAALVGAPGDLAAVASSPARDALLDPGSPVWELAAPDLFRVRFETSRGAFVLQVSRRWAPHGADRIYNLVRLGFYDDTRFYRVREGFIAQFGLSGDPAVNAVWYERTMPDDPVRRSNAFGVVSFAMLEDADSRTTQLFINLADNSRLDAQRFAPVGHVVAGMEVVESLYSGYDESAGGGMRGGNQGEIVSGGNAHLDAEFPLLDRIFSARIEPGSIMRFPDTGGNRIRIEEHLLPAVTTGPLDPAWSPDGQWIAFSMRGDIWKVPADGGEAVALTHGPAYHYEPAWSPDGTALALSMELDGNFDIGVVDASGAGAGVVDDGRREAGAGVTDDDSAATGDDGASARDTGGEVRRLTRHPHIDVQPAWSADGTRVLFASARGQGFDIYSVAVSGGAPIPVVAGPGHQIQPAVAPDGATLAFVSPLRGRLGSGAIWSTELPAGVDDVATSAAERLQTATMVHYEETSYRAQPSWTPDGKAILWVSDAAGSNDIAVVPAGGGSVARLTEDGGDEYSPVASPDGRRIAFVSNRSGPTRLYTSPAGGARRTAWRQVRITSRRAMLPSGRVRILVRNAGTDQLLPARVVLTASDERGYAPDGGFHRTVSPTDMHSFYLQGAAEVEVPVGTVRVEAMHGFEFEPAAASVHVAAGTSTPVILELQRLIDAPARGWYSGDTHAHDLHQGRHGLSRKEFFGQLMAEDLHVTNALIHMDGTRIMGRWEDLTGEPSPLSTADHILQYAQEFRGSFGHVGLLGISEFVMPLIGGTPSTQFAADVLNFAYLDAAREQDGIGGFMHPYTRPVRTPADGAFSEIALDVALGKGTFFDIGSIWYDELANAAMYYRFLNAGFHLAATGGSDNFADAWRDPGAGTDRTYALVHGPLSLPTWLEAVAAGRTFATTGPLLFLQVNGEEPGAQLDLGRGDPVQVKINVASAVPIDRVEIVANGKVVYEFDARSAGRRFSIEHTLDLPEGGWVTARALGPPARAVTDSYAFAQTSPVWVERQGRSFRSASDARFLADMVRSLWRRVSERDRFADPASRERYRGAVNKAIGIYEKIAASADTAHIPSAATRMQQPPVLAATASPPNPAPPEHQGIANPAPHVHQLPASPQTVAWGYYWSEAEPVLEIDSGDIVEVTTMITNSPTRLEAAGVPPEKVQQALRDIYDQVADRGPGGHILNGPIFVREADPGDVLEVRVLSIDLPIDYGYNGCRGFLPDNCSEPRTRIIGLDREAMLGHFAEGIDIPLRPFFGSMGVAPPPAKGRVSSNPPSTHAGNLDNKELVAGTRLFIPVHVAGALFEVGDGHAAQGDGEVDQTAIETSLHGRLQLIVHKDRTLEWPRAETPTHLITMGADEDLTVATRIAVQQMIELLMHEASLDRGAAYALASIAADLRITELVDGNVGVHMMIPKAILPIGPDGL